MNVRVNKKKTIEESDEGLEDILEDLEQGEPDVTPEDAALVANRRMARIAYYSAAASIVTVIIFAWLASFYVITLETKLNESSAATMQQLDGRISKLESSAFAPQKPPQPTFVEFTLPENAPRVGSGDAKVTVVEFADFQCPYCGKFQETVYAQLKKDYIDTGKVLFAYQDFTFLGEESDVSAQAAKCAGEQGKFWEYHDYLYSHQKGENQGAFAVKNQKTFAKTLNLKTAAFNTCLDSGKFASAVEAETAAGRALGITGTPTVLVNGKVYVGALPYATFKQAIEEALAK